MRNYKITNTIIKWKVSNSFELKCRCKTGLSFQETQCSYTYLLFLTIQLLTYWYIFHTMWENYFCLFLEKQLTSCLFFFFFLTNQYIYFLFFFFFPHKFHLRQGNFNIQECTFSTLKKMKASITWTKILHNFSRQDFSRINFMTQKHLLLYAGTVQTKKKLNSFWFSEFLWCSCNFINKMLLFNLLQLVGGMVLCVF